VYLVLYRVVCGLLEFVYCSEAFELLGNLCWVWVCVVQVRTVADTDRLAQARCAEARPELYARVVAQATRVCFERAHNSPRREGSRLSMIPRCFLVPVWALA